AIKTADTIRNQVTRILSTKNTSVVITEYYNPFNVDSHFFFKVGRLGCGTIGLSSCYDRTRYGIETLNTELRDAVFVPLSTRYTGRVAMTRGIYDEFIGRVGSNFLHSHDSPAPECGVAPPEINGTWVQYPSDKESYSYPGDKVPYLVILASGVDV